MSPRRFWLLVGVGVAAVVMLARMALQPEGGAPANPTAARVAARPARRSPPPLARRFEPLAPEWETGATGAMPAAVRAAPELPDEVPADLRRAEALATPPSPPPPPPQPAPSVTAADWIDDYQRATCGCPTRACVRDLQDRFVDSLRNVSYEADRDEERYAAAAREAVRCYLALPEAS